MQILQNAVVSMDLSNKQSGAESSCLGCLPLLKLKNSKHSLPCQACNWCVAFIQFCAAGLRRQVLAVELNAKLLWRSDPGNLYDSSIERRDCMFSPLDTDWDPPPVCLQEHLKEQRALKRSSSSM